MYDFYSLNPYVSFMYFTFVIFFAMAFTQPLFALASVAFSLFALLAIEKQIKLKRTLFSFTFAIFIAILNPLVNTRGNTVLFYIFKTRPYTLEALLYGMVLACIFVSSVNWFICFSKVVSTDKFLHIFSPLIPSLCLVITLALRLIPFYSRLLGQISGARNCIGLKNTGKLKAAAHNFSALASNGFDGAIITSDSMKSRGYGCGKPTFFSIYHFTLFDKLMAFIQIGLFLSVMFYGFTFATTLTAFPVFVFALPSSKEILALTFYILLMLMPAVTTLVKEIKWHFSISKI